MTKHCHPLSSGLIAPYSTWRMRLSMDAVVYLASTVSYRNLIQHSCETIILSSLLYIWNPISTSPWSSRVGESSAEYLSCCLPVASVALCDIIYLYLVVFALFRENKGSFSADLSYGYGEEEFPLDKTMGILW